MKVCDFGLSRVIQGSQDESTLGKLRGTYAYSAPEVYKGDKYTDKSDVFSLGIILWEAVARILTGEYQRPYKEYNYKIDFQIIINSAKHGKRPKLGLDICPEPLRNLMMSCWDPSPNERPDAAQALKILKDIQQEYEDSPESWDALVGTLGDKPAEPKVEVVQPNPTPIPAPVTPKEEPESKWSHKTIDDFLSNNETASVPAVDKKRNSSRNSKIEIKQEESKANNGKVEIEVASAWRSTVDWREEDDFEDDSKKKKKKKWGTFKLFGKSKK